MSGAPPTAVSAVSAERLDDADRTAPASLGRAAARLLLTTVLAVPVAIIGIVFGTAAAAQRNLFSFIGASSRLSAPDIHAIEAAVAALALYAVVLVGLAWVTRPRRVQPAPATMELGDDPVPPAVAGFLVNMWLTPQEAAQGTLLDLGARHLLQFEQTQPGHTLVRLVPSADASTLLPYERRVFDHVRTLASGGSVPGDALAGWPHEDPAAWLRAFEKEVAADARRRGLSRARWPAWSRLALSAAALAPAILGALAVNLAPRISSRGGQHNQGLALATGITIWVVLSGLHLLIRSERDTPRGRVAAAHWLGVRRQLHGDEVFPSLPPSAIAIWDRYLGYGAALGAAGEAVRQLPLGAEDPRHAWSSYGGRWRLVTVRYPRLRPGWGRSPWRLLGRGLLGATIGLAPLLLLLFTARIRATAGSAPALSADAIPADLRWATPLAVLFAVIVLGVALWYLVLAGLDLTRRRTVVGLVLRVKRVTRGDSEGQTVFYWLAVDDGTRASVDAWRVDDPAKMRGVEEGKDVRAVITPQCAHLQSIGLT